MIMEDIDMVGENPQDQLTILEDTAKVQSLFQWWEYNKLHNWAKIRGTS